MYVQNDIERPRFKTDAFVTSLIPFSIASRDQRGISNPLANRCRRTSNCVKTKLLTNSSRIRSRLFTASSKSNWCSLIESGHFSSTIERSSLDFWLWVHPERRHSLVRTYVRTIEHVRRFTSNNVCYGYERVEKISERPLLFPLLRIANGTPRA